MKKFKKIVLRILISLAALYLLLLIPDGADTADMSKPAGKPFTWNRDDQWKEMEERFMQARREPHAQTDSLLQTLRDTAENELQQLQENKYAAADSSWAQAENNFFRLSAFVAVRPASLPWYTGYYTRFRNLLKQRSQQWNLDDKATRNSVYALSYGMRAAVEEVLLQQDTGHLPPAMPVKEEKSATPSTRIFGIEVHSGDLLVSRGGAEVSALISRGNDYPGNFSHVALVYVEEKTNKAWLIEAHIERGVAVSSVEQYENDKKLRFMVLRLRSDLPALQANPQLPQQAAAAMYQEALQHHIPYDFKMNFHDSTAMFCSEVASYAYLKKGVKLWQSLSTISSPGIINWLHVFGVENFVTQMPSDLEYDPQLSVVAEWWDPATLYKDHIDNAVMDVLLEKANSGERIGYNHWKLPLVRIVKGYCLLKNLFGKTGIIPEGMSATQALKNQTFVAMHAGLRAKTIILADAFTREQGYRPPYWQLVKLARQSAQELN
ncbi:MAG: YiiX/YebB-like N1pC/P60 family cysteine hydrolase [Ferruginibacter sp.]